MSRISKLYLQDIIECCENAQEYTSGMTFREVSADKKTIDAVVRNLEIIGEAVKSMPDDILQTRPEIEWKKVARFRDIVVHHYFKVDLEVVWDIVQNRLPELKAAVRQMLIEISKQEK